MRRVSRFLWISPVFLSISLAVINQKAAEPGERPPGRNILWMDPGDVSSLDFVNGPGGPESRPQPPFRFVDEDMSGTIPKVNVTDDRGIDWNVKFGPEARASTFCSRLLWACGYVAQIEHFLPSGRIEGVQGLQRAKSRISQNGSFRRARFQLRTDSPKYLKGESWTWAVNPFKGTPQFQGLRILVMLVSNWDTKDARDFIGSGEEKRMDSNLAIFEDIGDGQRRYLYAAVDWGASLGRWGGKLSWSKWDCRGFEAQTPNFVKPRDDGGLAWGFVGKHRKDLKNDISVDDVRWLLQYLSKISDEQIQSGLTASGAKPNEVECYTRALRRRIDQLERIAGSFAAQKPSLH